ncbi:hypothetical protein [Halovenus marina]|uniref:hypothetical protein n=1 Tax=Halovenus marina TaxID=3396621 RepID=UPI003F56AE65
MLVSSQSELVEKKSYRRTDSSYFEAHRTESHVADADGPNGEGNGFIAYHEEDGVQGVTGDVFESELWNDNPLGFPDMNADYISKNDMPNIECPGNTVRCIVPIDVSTKENDWGTNPSQSFKISITG